MPYKIGYARVSTKEQNLDAQIAKLKEAGCKKIFCDKGSGASNSRKELRHALDHIHPDEGNVLVVCRMDRLARSLKGLTDILSEVDEKGASVSSLAEPTLSTSGSQGRLLLHILGAVADFELSLIRERTRDAQKVAKANGKHFGRSPKLTKQEQETIYRRVSSGHITRKDASKMYGVKPPTITRIMRKYYGGVAFDMLDFLKTPETAKVVKGGDADIMINACDYFVRYEATGIVTGNKRPVSESVPIKQSLEDKRQREILKLLIKPVSFSEETRRRLDGIKDLSSLLESA